MEEEEEVEKTEEEQDAEEVNQNVAVEEDAVVQMEKAEDRRKQGEEG